MVVFYSKNLIYNAKFDKTKFSALKMRVSASKIYKFIALQNDRFIKKSAEFN